MNIVKRKLLLLQILMMKKFNRKVYSMKENKDIEKILLNDSAYEKMVKSKIEREFKQELAFAKNTRNKVITDIKKVPKEKLFTKSATYEVINKNSKTKSFINGVQAEGYLGAKNSDRIKLLEGKTDSFICGSNFVKFVKVKI